MTRLFAFVAAILAFHLAACTPAVKPPIYVEKPVIVEKVVYVPIEPALTSHPAQIPVPRNDSGAELLRVSSQRKTDLKVCYGKLDSIGTVQGTVKP